MGAFDYDDYYNDSGDLDCGWSCYSVPLISIFVLAFCISICIACCKRQQSAAMAERRRQLRQTQNALRSQAVVTVVTATAAPVRSILKHAHFSCTLHAHCHAHIRYAWRIQI